MPTGLAEAALVAETFFAENVIAGFLLKAAASVAFNFAISAVFGGDKQPTASPTLANNSQTLTGIDSAAPWEIVYGQVRKGGAILFRHATDSIQQTQSDESDVIPHTGPYTVTLDDAANYISTVSLTAKEWIPPDDTHDVGRYEDTIYAETGGAPAQGQYSVAAGVYTFNGADAGKSIAVVFLRRTVGTEHNRLHLIIVLAAHECESIDKIYFNDEEVPLDVDGNATGTYADHVLIKKHLGTPGEAADATLIAEAPDKWTTEHTLDGHCYIYCRLFQSLRLFKGQFPNITVLVKGKKVYDGVSATAWSDTASLCIMDYVNNDVWGLNAAYATEIDATLLSAAAAIDEEAVALAVGGTEKRYALNGVVDTSMAPQQILEKMLTANAGRLVYVGGEWRIRSGAYITPAITLDEGDMRGALDVKIKRDPDEVFNRVKGLYLSPDNHWQPADFPAVTSDTYLAQDNGVPKWENIDLPFTTSGATAQRIAKIVLERIRRQVSVAYKASLAGYRVEPPETMMLSNTILGYSSKVFEVMELKLAVENDEHGAPILVVNHALQETDSAVYTWTTADESEVAAAPTTTLPDPRQIAPPGVPSVTESLYETTGSTGVKAKAMVTWAPAPQGQAWRYELEWKLKSAAVWTPNGGPINGATDEVFDLPAGTYQFRVRTLNAIGGQSEWSQSEKEIFGLTAPPADLTAFSLQVLNGLAHLVWNQAADLDVKVGGLIRIRWSPATSGAEWNEAIDIGPAVAGIATQTTLPLLAGTYLAKPVDSTGHASVNAISITTNAPEVLGMNVVTTLAEHPAWAGTKSNVVYDPALVGLKLDAASTIDSMTDPIDDWPSIDSIGGVVGSGTYTAANTIDLGAKYTSRVTASLSAEGYDTQDTWDDRTDLIDTWLSIDGDVVDDAQVQLFIRTTDDNPAGSPTWSGWQPFLVGDYTCRAFQFRAEFATATSTHNVLLKSLAITVDMPDRVEGDDDIASGAGAKTITYAYPFNAAPAVGVTAQNMATGDYYVVTSKSATGFTVTFKNAGGSAVNRTFDWIAKGYGALTT